MLYTPLGNTGYTVSRLGFGSMRLPMLTIGGKEYVDVDRAVATFHRAFELGVNYVDCGFLYCSQESELAVGTALAAWPRRSEIVLTTKCTKFAMSDPGDMRRMLEHQLWRLRTDHVDFYLFHGVGWDNWHEIDAKTGWFADMRRAKEEGLAKHVGFSFHDKPEMMNRLVDEGIFDLVTCQYNYLDRANEVAIHYAADHGLGVVVMGPVGGGRLAMMPKALRRAGLSATNAAELALRFVVSHPGVSLALSGMGSVEMVEQNCAAIAKGALSADERATVARMMGEIKALADLYCTGCQYCMSCPNGLNIPELFQLYNYYKVYGLEDYAVKSYRQAVAAGHDATTCARCGVCLDRCPQHIAIPDQMAQVAELFAGLV